MIALAGVAASGEAPAPGWWQSLLLYIAQQQRDLYLALREALAGLQQGHWAALATLLGLSFGYGVFHAAGPGHGKAIIASYLAATRDTLARGVTLSVLSSMAQAVTAIVLVGVLAILLDFASRTVMAEAIWIERASFVAAILLGLYLVAMAIYEAFTGRHVHLFHGHGGPAHTHDHHDHGHRHDHHDHHHHDHGHAGHSHVHAAPAAEPLFSLKSLGLIASIGLRPCAGAILVLLFSLTQGILWAGIAAAFAMAAGTAITVASIAVLTVIARQGALKAADSTGGWSRPLFLAARIAGGLVLVLFGITLLMAPAVTTPFGTMPGT